MPKLSGIFFIGIAATLLGFSFFHRDLSKPGQPPAAVKHIVIGAMILAAGRFITLPLTIAWIFDIGWPNVASHEVD